MSSIPFNMARGAANILQMAPPFAFSDVTMSVFPLRASLPTLENFCRNYLNQAPDLVQFRPFIPYVYLVILDYGRMSVEAANMGWISQREVAFGVPMRWLNATQNGLEFHDWAFTSPFIFVDNELSMSTGREVFGWPKLLARLDPSVSEWVRNPHGARRVFEISTQGAITGYAGQTSEYHSLLSVYQHRTAGLLDLPPNLDVVTKPIQQAPKIAASLSRLSLDLSKTFLGMLSDGITGSSVLPDMGDIDTLRAQLEPEQMERWLNAREWSRGLKESLWSMFPRMYANTINFKQFRDTANPQSTCYQAITCAKMPVTSLKEGGFLGPQNMLLGQLDGGFHIEISDLAGLPIVDTLGLEVESEWVANGTTVSKLVPVAPVWMKVDMTYGLGETIVWRGRRDYWNAGKILKEARRDAEKNQATAQAEETEETPAQDGADATDTQLKAPHREPDHSLDDVQGFDYLQTMNFFNTTRGASEAVGGSFSVPDASVRVLPLKANHADLQRFVTEYLRVEGHTRFEAWGDYVYLVVNDFKQMNSQQSALTRRRARELGLLVPVKCYDWYDDAAFAEVDSAGSATPAERDAHGREKLLTTGFVNAFNYVDDVETAITANEVFGVPSMGSTIRSSENDWLSRDRGSSDVHETILKMRSKVMPELMAGAKAVDRTIVEICGGWGQSESHAHEARQTTVNRWVELLANDLRQKAREAGRDKAPKTTKRDQAAQTEAINIGEGFALELLAGELPFNQFSLKQFRDGEYTSDACYQGLVQRRHKIRKITDISELAGPLHVTITDFPTQPITELLGLIPKFSYPGKDRIVRVFEPVRPFSFNGDLVRGAGMTLFERIGSDQWQPVDLPDQVFGWRELTRDEAERIFKGEELDGGVPPSERAEDVAQKKIKVGRDPGESEADAHNKIVSEHSPAAVRSWYKIRADNGVTKNIKIRQRDHPNTLRLIKDEALLNAYDPHSGTDLPAWLHHAHDEIGFQHSQSDIAARIERISPATVLDKVLSRQWGKTKNSTFYATRYADFCLPVHTVPHDDAHALFPPIERQGQYWPQSDDYLEQENKRWRGETNAFKYELQASLRLLSMAFPQSVADNMPDVVYIDEPSDIFTYLADVLNAWLDDDQPKIKEELVQRSISGIGGKDDEIAMTRANEDITFAFFEAHLPDSIKLQRVSLFRTGKMERLFEEQTKRLSSEEWREVAEGIESILTKMADARDQFPKGMLGLDALAKRALNNSDLVRKNDASQPPGELLQARLRTRMSGLGEDVD
ncbi:MAG: hypothetical protein AAF700_02025 [Pseudomonadota bacterium]